MDNFIVINNGNTVLHNNKFCLDIPHRASRISFSDGKEFYEWICNNQYTVCYGCFPIEEEK